MMKMIYYHQDSLVWMTSEFDWQHPLGTCVSAEQVELGSGTLLPQGPSCNSVSPKKTSQTDNTIKDT